jgi:hypothetical protein
VDPRRARVEVDGRDSDWKNPTTKFLKFKSHTISLVKAVGFTKNELVCVWSIIYFKFDLIAVISCCFQTVFTDIYLTIAPKTTDEAFFQY